MYPFGLGLANKSLFTRSNYWPNLNNQTWHKTSVGGMNFILFPFLSQFHHFGLSFEKKVKIGKNVSNDLLRNPNIYIIYIIFDFEIFVNYFSKLFIITRVADSVYMPLVLYIRLTVQCIIFFKNPQH